MLAQQSLLPEIFRKQYRNGLFSNCEGDMQIPICGTVSLVLKMSRLFGLTPLTFGADGIKFSQVYYLYSIVFITALKMAIVVVFYLDAISPKIRVSFHSSNCASKIIMIAYQFVLSAVTLVGCLTAPKRCRSMLHTLTRIEKIKMFMEETENEYGDIKSIYMTILYCLTALVIVILSDLYQTLSEPDGLINKVVATSLILLYDIEYLIELLLEFQFMLVVFKLTIVLRAVNKRLNLLQRKVSDEQSNEEIRVLWLVNEQVCDLVRNVDKGFGLILLLLMQSIFLHFIMTPYFLIKLYQMPSVAASICNEMAWLHFHATRVVLVIDPCHLLQKQMIQIRSLVSELFCQLRPYGRLSRCLAAFFKSLTMDQPLIAPLGMFVLKRPLLLTILGIVSSYLVPCPVSIPYSTNVVNGTNVSIYESDNYF